MTRKEWKNLRKAENRKFWIKVEGEFRRQRYHDPTVDFETVFRGVAAETGRNIGAIPFTTGIADGAPIPPKRHEMMKLVRTTRLNNTTVAERKMCFALQAICWSVNYAVRSQREKVFHISDMLSRSVDFYFSQSKLGIEVDGPSHSGELQSAKDKWTDEIMLGTNVLILRFKNDYVMNSIHEVASSIVNYLRSRHNWPYKIRARFDQVASATRTGESWYKFTTLFIESRKSGARFPKSNVPW